MEVRFMGARLPDDVSSTVGSGMAMLNGPVSQPADPTLSSIDLPPFADSSQAYHFIPSAIVRR
jgi:hypothetical protein